LDTVVSDDASLIDATLAGDTEAFGRLVERYQDRLYNSLLRFLGSAEDARDVSQDTFLQALTKLRSFRRESGFYTWLYRIGFNLAMSRRRRMRPEMSIDCLKHSAGVEPSDDGVGPERLMEAKERAAAVQAALGRLADEHREVVVLREIEECSYETIAEILNVPIGTVRSRLFRARMQLREHLEELFREEVEA
jgi:RNA polymerase sigma-70 factor (ECF subfamily)